VAEAELPRNTGSLLKIDPSWGFLVVTLTAAVRKENTVLRI
jgi:hypothetical protein